MRGAHGMSAKGNPVSLRNRGSGHVGMTLLEVLIALAIFLAAVTVIGQLVNTGSQAAIGAQLKAEASRRAETVMAEAIAGVVPLQSASSAFDDDPAWSWTLSVQDATHADMLLVEVIVARQGELGREQTNFHLVRWVRDPELWLQSTVETTTTTEVAP